VLKPPAISLPATLEVHVRTADMAEVASWVRGVDRTGVRTVSIQGEDPLAMFRSFVGVTYITRVSEGRLGGRSGGLGTRQARAGSGRVRRGRASDVSGGLGLAPEAPRARRAQVGEPAAAPVA
jgi:hypothetical protein